MKIGYSAFSKDLSHPADRRRIGFWAANRGIKLELANYKDLDFMVFSEKSSPKEVIEYKGGYKVLDLIDGYLSSESFLHDIGRGLSKNISQGEVRYFRPFTKLVQQMCKSVDLVICSSEEQATLIKPFNSNIRIILDSHDEIKQRHWKPKEPCFRNSFFWEGQSATLSSLDSLSEVFLNLSDRNKMSLKVVTDLSHYRLMNRFLPIDSKKLIPSVSSVRDLELTFTKWSLENVYQESALANLALLPVNLANGLGRYKPENRVLLFWRLGLPVLATNSLSNLRVEEKLGFQFTCSSKEDWVEKIENLSSNQKATHEYMSRTALYLSTFHNTQVLLKAWDEIFSPRII